MVLAKPAESSGISSVGLVACSSRATRTASHRLRIAAASAAPAKVNSLGLNYSPIHSGEERERES